MNDLLSSAVVYSQNACIGDVFCLYGDLGAGKTTFARAFIQHRYPETVVPSPTFTLVQIYDEIAHYDLYRIQDPEELLELEIMEHFHNKICLIEWPERLGFLYPEHAIRIDIPPYR